jgi:hypothetical protein
VSDVRTARLKDRALVAEVCLRLESARQYGLIEGGPEVDVEACQLAIHTAKAAGITWTEAEVERVTKRELDLWAQERIARAQTLPRSVETATKQGETQ